MDEWASLRQAIVDDPDDDARRLVAADWLEENGRVRESEFVRAQVQLARCVEEPADPFESTAGLWDRQLAADLRRLLLPPFLPLVQGPFRDEGRRLRALCQRFAFGFRRGFVDALVIYGAGAAANFSELGEELFARVPLLHLCFSSAAERPPHVYPPGHANYGDAHTELTEDRLRAFLELSLMARLRTLDLRGHRFGNPGAELVLHCACLGPNLRLRLDGNLITTSLEGPLRERFGKNLMLLPCVPEDEIPF